jgi:hypothetical protein
VGGWFLNYPLNQRVGVEVLFLLERAVSPVHEIKQFSEPIFILFEVSRNAQIIRELPDNMGSDGVAPPEP